ncbi:hypothetical protein [Pseudorhodoferax sp. Leaf267]|uniref:hypothetical protein n=1 Tax=Pseudorhodoferax sp. Leaf267 TaxID=1736316 RepID=UPI0006FC7F51|nr:hypothetical protein [Pseudorhodoferax sp. Leaf267]
MRTIALLCAAFVAAPAFAGDLVAYEGTDMIRLTPQTCTNQAVLNRIDPEVRELFLTASATLRGQRYTACWSITPTAAYLVYEDGDQGLIPLTKLQVPVDI